MKHRGVSDLKKAGKFFKIHFVLYNPSQDYIPLFRILPAFNNIYKFESISLN